MSMDIKEKSEFQLIDIMKLIAAFLVIGKRSIFQR